MNLSESIFFSSFYFLHDVNALSALSDHLTIYAVQESLLQLFSSLLNLFIPQETKATYGSINYSCVYAMHMEYIHIQ